MKQRFVSLPSECYAERWFPGHDVEGVFAETRDEVGRLYGRNVGGQRFYVVTAQGKRAYLTPGDWVVQEPYDATRHYPCSDEVFVKRWTLAPR